MVNDVEDDDPCPKPVGRNSVFYYGVGHMLNDITAACWFTYLLLFLTEIGLSPRDAAIIMLAGQIADGFATVFAGELDMVKLCDRKIYATRLLVAKRFGLSEDLGIDRFGHFKVWHGAGSILAAISFSSVFGGCFPCKFLASRSPIIETISYSTSAAIFNVGWAATQVSHMSMVNCISLNSTSRVVMTSCRNAFTMVANLSLYAVALVVFSTTKATTHSDIENQYHWIAYTSIFIGCCFVGIFHLGTKEPRLKIHVHGTSYARMSWAYWFKKVLYYQVGLVYMLTRLAQNVSQAYLAFYVIEDLQMAKSAKALVPAIIYISSFIVSIIMQEMSWTGQRLKAYYCAGGVLWVFCGTSIIFLPRSFSAFMYVISVFIGIANTPMTVTGVSMQSVLVGSDLNGCAFVYGSLSFLDKVSCGLAVFVLQSFQRSSPRSQETLSTEYISVTRYGFGLLPAVCSLTGMGITYTMKLRTPHSKSLMEPLLLD
ncbi:hypothetical protein SADUNF_Sadunf09G0016700 [Salix dunnii]|uniref:Major facilitator superfamily domain-containing protein 12 n=1 Tax=Salix dunnii TaxID=1413687 RepID=A0A835MRS7_9ROSI|nr:hypothetical protein SADUNF_Sadunf09G0016700 [Salix dunnii]